MKSYDKESAKGKSSKNSHLPLLEQDGDSLSGSTSSLISLAYVVGASIVSYILVVTFVLLQT